MPHTLSGRSASDDTVRTANEAGLRFVSDEMPGYSRRRAGNAFTYVGVDGQPVRDDGELDRIRGLAIPPAWTEVWIAPTARGHIQATGRDAKGRKQYRYHARWRAARDETKYGRMIAFGEALPCIRARVTDELAAPGLSRERVLATVLRLLDETDIRVGNQEYARENKSFGLTTLHNRHVEIAGSTLRFQFRGKSGKEQTVEVRDRRVAKIVQRCQELPGQELFQYLDDTGERRLIESGDVNDYLREISGHDFTAKDFRTWAGTVVAAHALQEMGLAETQAAARQNVTTAVKLASERLGNTPAICRRCYVHPRVVTSYLDGSLMESEIGRREMKLMEGSEGLTGDEAKVLAFLRRIEREEAGCAGRKAG